MKRVLDLVMLLPHVNKRQLLKYTFLGILSGLFSFLFINAVTLVVGLIIAGELTRVSIEYVILFTSTILLFIWTRGALSLAVIRLSQSLFWSLRINILSLVLKANYQQMVKGKVEVHAALVNDVNVLTNASMGIINFFTSVILAVSCLVYLLSISLILFGITLVIALIGVVVYHLSSGNDILNFRKARGLENKFQENFNAILDGFKEIYLEPKKGKAIFDQKIRNLATEAYINNTRAQTGFLNNQIIGQVLFYILISSVLLFFSIWLNIKASDTISFVFTLLYLLNSIEMVMILLPQIARANVASTHLLDLKKRLEDTNSSNLISETFLANEEFEGLSIRNLEFYYGEQDKSFGIGPVNFDVQKGEIVFIYGGNGSGKTTFIHSLVGLCMPSDGEIRCNGILINEKNYAGYRSLFSVVFSDFYLFNELLAIDKLDVEKWNYYLELFELEDKVKIEGKSFSTTDLSTGQRKRLALISALLEAKPVLVIDEWAADQDPYFRRKFYTEILSLLKEEGFTIIAITHDDKYYHCADKLYRMDYGKLVEESINVLI
jgi:putative pyoverdin transport system ATP-binding/permease protein